MSPNFFKSILSFVLLFCQLAFAELPDVTEFTVGENASTIEIEYIPAIFYLNATNVNVTLAPVRKRVTYTVRNGLAIVEGDQILSTEADLLAARVDDDPQVQKKKRSLSIFPAAPLVNLRKWPNGRVEYKWEDQNAKDIRGAAFDAAVRIWRDRVPSIQFVEISAPDATLTAGGAITLRYVDSGVSSSPAGRAMNLAGTQFCAECNVMELGNCNDLASCASLYAHEIGHTLGLKHEQKRPDREAYVDLICENIRDLEYVDNNGNTVIVPPVCGTDDTCDGYGCQFSTVDPLEYSWAGAYDLQSIMHYRANSFRKSPGLITLQAKPGFVVAPSEFPTLTDARRVCDIYWEVCRGVCGDGILSPNNEEECDDGNNVSGDGCSSSCRKEAVCGNGILEPGEECDDGNLVDGDGCNALCKTEYCGDGIVQPGLGETCDEGANNGAPGVPCDSNCKPPCIETCNPTSGLNHCAAGTSCIRLDEATGPNAGKHMCACAHGFRATGYAAGDTSKQIRVPASSWPSQEDRVFVAPGVECGQLCNHWTLGVDLCSEVPHQPQCF